MAIDRDEVKIGRYEVTEELGRGSMGVVHLAHDPLMCRDVAVKTIYLPHDLPDGERDRFQMRFLQEARTAGSLTHPGIVTIYDFDRSPETGLPFIAMEYVEGRTLHEVLTTDGPLSWEQAFSMVDTLADALLSAHRSGIVHQDIKPANILVRESDGAPKIADFGIACIHSTHPEDQGPTYGSPAYMAPERIKGLPSDARSDLFSLAVILYEALTGSRPFGGEDSTSICQAITHEPPVPVTQRDPKLSPSLNRFFEKALAKDPARRFKDASTFKRHLGMAYGEQRMFGDGVATIQMSTQEITLAAPGSEPTAREQFKQWLLSAPLQSVPWLQSVPGKPWQRWIVIGGVALALVLISFGVGWSMRGGTPHDASLTPGKGRSGAVARPVAGVSTAIDPVAADPAAADFETADSSEPAPVARPVREVPANHQLPPRTGVDRGPTVSDYEAFTQSRPDLVWPAPVAAEPVVAERVPAKTPVVKAQSTTKAPEPEKTVKTLGAKRASTPARTTVPHSQEPVAAIAPTHGLLKLAIRSAVKAGSIALTVDGREVYSADLVSDSTNKLRRFVGKDRQEIDSELRLTPGPHTIQASLIIEGKPRAFERDLALEVGADENRTLRIVAGRSIGRRLSLTLEEAVEPVAEASQP